MNHVVRSFVVVLVVVLSGLAVLGQKDAAGSKPDPLLGKWKSDEAVIDIKADGNIVINGDNYRYKVKGAVIMVYNDEGSLLFPYELSGDVLRVDAQGREVVYKRMKPDDKNGSASTGVAAIEAIVPAFVGKWCYMSSLTGTNSYMSSRCFTLYENGTYEFYAESSTSGSYGGTSGQSYDTGRWTATRTTLTAYSTKSGKIVYPIELRNHPKTRDPMIVVDGDAYVTAYKKNPW